MTCRRCSPELRAAVRAARAAPYPPAALPGGEGARLHPRDVPAATLLRGARHELEHTGDPRIAIEVALDHLARDRRYYTRLERMERPAKRRPAPKRARAKKRAPQYVAIAGRLVRL